MNKTKKANDPINPNHYKDATPQPIEVINGWGLGFCLGNVVKYLCRAGKKPDASYLQDLKKAAWYLNHEIQQLEKEKENGNEIHQ